MSTTPAAPSASRRRCCRTSAARPYVEADAPGISQASPTRTRAREADKQRLPLAKARANALKVDWAGLPPPKPSFLGTRGFATIDLAELARLHRLDAVLPDLGAEGPLSRAFSTIPSTARRRGACSTTRRRC